MVEEKDTQVETKQTDGKSAPAKETNDNKF